MRIIPNLRNLFNQYEQEENRLTHSLLHTIARSDKLFIDFLKFAVGKYPFNKKDKVYIGSQGRYGGEISKNIAKRGKKYSIPDALIHDSNRYCILIESKVTASIKMEQLGYHLKQVRNKFEYPILLLLTTDKEKPEKFISALQRKGQKVYWKGWWEIYGWIDSFKNQSLVKDFKEYMEFLEADIINRNVGWGGMVC